MKSIIRRSKVAFGLIAIGVILLLIQRVSTGINPPPCDGPAITLQPQSQTTCDGQVVSFTAAASGSPTPTVQWLVRTNSGQYHAISGATNETLTFTAMAVENGYKYKAQFFNCGVAFSSNATLTVDLIDTVGDGISDCWRQQYFGSGTTTNSNSCASCDPDGDGLSNLQEFQAGTNPTNYSVLFLVCPPTVIVNVDDGTNIATQVDLGQPVMIGCGNASFTSNLPPQFIVGTNAVTWTAVCGSSFTSQCSQAVIVLASQSCITVPGIASNGVPWISVVSNQTYQYQASGCVLYSPQDQYVGYHNVYSHPDGIRTTNGCSLLTNYYTGTNFAYGTMTCSGASYLRYSLVGKINGDCIQLGTGGVFTAFSSGTLTLYFNDDKYNDNSDSFTVCITSGQTASAGIALVAPTNGQAFVVNQNIILVANAYTSTGTITKVQFFADSVQIGQSTTAPYYYIWPGINIAAGSHVLSATASNSLGNFYTSNVATINVANAISVVITNPSNQAVFHEHANIPIGVTVSPTGNINNVEFYIDSVLLTTDVTYPYSAFWSNATPGTHALTARATHALGVQATSTPVWIVVRHSPSVQILSPQNGQTFAAPAQITLTALAEADTPVTSVAYYTNGTYLVGSTNLSPYRVVLTHILGGTNAFTAVVADADGYSATSSPPVQITVQKQPPVVAITYPHSNDVFAIGQPIPILAAATDLDGTVTNVQFRAGNVVLGNDTNPPFSFTWTSGLPTTPTTNLTAMAWDNDGLTGTSTQIPINIATCTIPGISNLTLSVSEIIGGNSLSGTVTLSNAAPSGGQAINLSSSSGTAILPTFVLVPQGQTSVAFAIDTLSVGNTNTVTISASYHGQSEKTASLTVIP